MTTARRMLTLNCQKCAKPFRPHRNSASNSGDSGSASNSGYRGVAVVTGEECKLEIAGKGALGAVTAKVWQWVVRPGAVVAWRWEDEAGLLRADDLGVPDGTLLTVVAGKPQIVDAQEVKGK